MTHQLRHTRFQRASIFKITKITSLTTLKSSMKSWTNNSSPKESRYYFLTRTFTSSNCEVILTRCNKNGWRWNLSSMTTSIALLSSWNLVFLSLCIFLKDKQTTWSKKFQQLWTSVHQNWLRVNWFSTRRQDKWAMHLMSRNNKLTNWFQFSKNMQVTNHGFSKSAHYVAFTWLDAVSET